jgi:hypothetical protein
MPQFKVTLHRRVRENYSGLPEPNPFLASIPAPGRTHQMILREWTFEAKNETEVRKLLNNAYGAGIPNVQGFSLRSIERLSNDTGASHGD